MEGHGAAGAGERTAYLLVDGENIDATFGTLVLHRKPESHERPRWERVREFVHGTWGLPVRALFFVNATRGAPWQFIQALRSMEYAVVPLGPPSEPRPDAAREPELKVVDLAILKTLEALRQRDGDVMLASHDGDFAEALGRLADGRRRLGILGFEEYLAGAFRQVPGLETYDIEDHAQAFDGGALPRLRVIPIDRYDPAAFLG